jgi:predicted RNA methylase
VKNTVGKLVEGKKPKGVQKLKILDPACGSGSFLIGAYQYLLDWHRDRYIEDGPEKWVKGRNAALCQVMRGEWRLTTAERKRILLTNIYGVDIDPQAVEVTKLSLLLKVLEGENEETLANQIRLFHERALPDLGNNVKCGNSLIGPDFYDNQQLGFFDDEERYRVNVFDWKKEFLEVFNNGGFDAVIGNPPYGYMISREQQQYLAKHYEHQDYQKDFYLLFLERYKFFIKYNGLLGVIVSNTWLQSVTLRKIRQYLTSRYLWLRILCLQEKVFRAIVDTHVLIFQRVDRLGKETGFLSVDFRLNGTISESHTLSWQEIPNTGDPINIIAKSEAHDLYDKVQQMSLSLSRICRVFNGVKPFEKGKGSPPQTDQVLKEKPYVREGAAPNKKWSPLLRGSLIHRYTNLWNRDYWIQYGPWLAAPRDPSIFEAPLKIVVRQTGDSIIGTLVEQGFIARNNLHVLLPEHNPYNLRYVLGIMNSKLMDFIYTIMNPEKGEALAEVKKKHVEQLPIHGINFSDHADKTHHDKMVTLVEQMLSLNKKLADAKTEHDRTNLQRQIDATDRQIDQLVYELYGLTDEEISIVEGNA